MLEKPSTCEGCPLFTTGKGFVPDETVPNADIVIVTEAPGKTEVHQGKPLVGSSGFVLRNWGMKVVPLIQMAYEKKKVSLCNVLKCMPPEVAGKAYPTGETRAKAEAHCAQYLNIGKPKIVILCGDMPQRYFFGKELAAEDAVSRAIGHDLKGVLGRVGRVYVKDGIKYVFSPDPSSVLKQPAFVSHLQEAFKIAAGQERLVEPTLLVWEKALTELL